MWTSVQHRPDGAGDLEWATQASAVLLPVSVEESGGFRATWTGSVLLPAGAGSPGLRRPGGTTDAGWGVLVEEHEMLDADPSTAGVARWRQTSTWSISSLIPLLMRD